MRRKVVVCLITLFFAICIGFLPQFSPLRWTGIAQGGPLVAEFYTFVTYPFNDLKNPTGLLLLKPSYGGSGYFHLYIADTNNHVIRKFTSTIGGLDTVAGTMGQAGYQNGTNALFDAPIGLTGTTTTWMECTGIHKDTCTNYDYQNIFINDAQNFVIRKVCSGSQNPSNPGACNYAVQTVCGNHIKGMVDGYWTNASFATLGGITMDGSTSYVADIENHAIRSWTGTSVATFAGDGTPGFVDGYRTSARFNAPTKSVRDSAGNMYVTDVGNHAIRKIDTAGNVTTFAGNGLPGFADGQGTAAQFSRPTAVLYNANCNCLYVADSHNNMIRKIDMSGNVTSYAGSPNEGGLVNGALGSARFATPTDIVFYNNFLYISDSGNNAIRRIDTVNQLVSTLIS